MIPACKRPVGAPSAMARGGEALVSRSELVEIGGSHAQRDLFAQVWLDSMMRAGQFVGAQNMLAQQVSNQPESSRLKRQAAQVYSALGLESLARSLRWS